MTDAAAGVADLDGWPEPPDDSIVGTPPRRAGSVRRTANIDMVWPGGMGTPLQLRGRARDLLTPSAGEPAVLAEAGMVASVGPGRTVEAIEAWPARSTIDRLVGAQGGSSFRSAIDAALPGEREDATPLYFLLDDIAGCSLIAAMAWSRHRPPTTPSPEPAAAVAADAGRHQQRPEPMGMRKGRIICSGLRPGGFAQRSRQAAGPPGPFVRDAGDLSTDDQWAWHEMEELSGVAMRRRRRVDVSVEDASISVDAHFRDTVLEPDGSQKVVHEYTLACTVDRHSRKLVGITAQPRVLPFPECPAAAAHVSQLLGLRVGGFRTSVQETLREIESCTHLNDMLRCLAEVHALATRLETAGSQGG